MKMRLKALARATALAFGGVAAAVPVAALAQAPAPAPAQAQPSQLEAITVTGSRIVRRDFETSSPIVTITAEELKANQDVTLETFLNSLPQVNAAGTTTSNNPGNGGQANIDLRGLGPNRNLVLVDGRRPMVSAADQTVDVNTIPLSMIESIEIISGGAAAVYGADAVSGVVNIRLKRRFEGVEINAGYSDSQPKHDAFERNVSATFGGNFDGRKGGAMMTFEYADREGLIKSQRDFAKVATATTSFFPEGSYRPGPNAPTQAAVDALFGQAAYGGIAAGLVPRTNALSFNTDGTLFSVGTFNRPFDVYNFRYPIDDGVNTRIFPDVYSYNFDAVNILTLPLERRSMMAKVDYKLANDIEVFGNFSNTRYTSVSALAPSPVSTINVVGTTLARPNEASSPLVTDTINPATVTPTSTGVPFNSGSQLVVPVTNPFIPADLAALLATRTGDNPALVGSGATEPFFMRWRTLAAGLREQRFENVVNQYVAGAKGPIIGSWTWDAHASEGRTRITTVQTGNIDTNRLQRALESSTGGTEFCAGGINPFGRQSLSAECIAYLQVANTTVTEFTQQIGQAFATGDIASLPAGPLIAVVGAEFRNFKYTFDPGSAAGPISGFNVQDPAGGTNSFKDYFGELAVPVLRGAPFAQEVDLSFGYRHSQSESKDDVSGVEAPKQSSDTWSANFNWVVNNSLRGRGSVQRSVRAPNFGELFSGGGSNPQIFDPCSVTSNARTTGANAAQLRTLCQTAGQIGGLGAGVDTFVQTPGTQASIEFNGNRELKPETGDSFTVGVVWQPNFGGLLSGFRASLDYYLIKVKDAITASDTNEIIADCYNYYGRNPAYDPGYTNCAGLFRAGDILAAQELTDDNGRYTSSNSGSYKTSGLDLLVAWGANMGPGRLDTTLTVNYLFEHKVRTGVGLPENDFAGTIPYFGAQTNLTTFAGQAFPEWKASLTGRYTFKPFAVDARLRYIAGMNNRMGVIFPGEESKFTGTSAVTYWDFAGSWEFARNATVRVGMNNAFNKQPPQYAPNVQSGTDPSTYDVIGRRLFAQLQVKFQ